MLMFNVFAIINKIVTVLLLMIVLNHVSKSQTLIISKANVNVLKDWFSNLKYCIYCFDKIINY